MSERFGEPSAWLETMLRWARVLIALFALATAMTNVAAEAATHDHASMHSMAHAVSRAAGPAGAMTLHRCHETGGQERGGVSCDMFACCALAPLAFADRSAVSAPMKAVTVANLIADDPDATGSRAPPDLRPPIA